MAIAIIIISLVIIACGWCIWKFRKTDNSFNKKVKPIEMIYPGVPFKDKSDNDITKNNVLHVERIIFKPDLEANESTKGNIKHAFRRRNRKNDGFPRN